MIVSSAFKKAVKLLWYVYIYLFLLIDDLYHVTSPSPCHPVLHTMYWVSSWQMDVISCIHVQVTLVLRKKTIGAFCWWTQEVSWTDQFSTGGFLCSPLDKIWTIKFYPKLNIIEHFKMSQLQGACLKFLKVTQTISFYEVCGACVFAFSSVFFSFCSGLACLLPS